MSWYSANFLYPGCFTVLQYDKSYICLYVYFAGRWFFVCFYLFDKSFLFQAAEQGSEIVVKQVRFLLSIIWLFCHLLFLFARQFPGWILFQPQPPLIQTGRTGLLHFIVIFYCYSLSGGGLLLFQLLWIWKRTADYCQDQTCFYRLLSPVGLWPKGV